MYIYIFIFSVLLLMDFSVKSWRERRIIYYFSLFFLFMFSAFRYEVGCDWTGYLNQFLLQQNSTLEDALLRLEPLWWLIIEGIIRLDLPYPWLNVISSAIFFLGLHALARRQPDPLSFLVLSFPILIINMPMSAIRQATAMGFLAFAYLAFMQRKLLRFVALVLLSSSIHASSIIFLLLSPFVKGEYSKRQFILSAFLALPGIYMLLQTDSFEVARARYISTGMEATGALARVSLLFLTAVFFHFKLKRYWYSILPNEYKLLILSSLAMLLLVPMLLVSSVIADRIAYYLVPVQIIMLSRTKFLPIPKNRKLFHYSPYFVIVLFFIVWMTNSWHFQKCYIPYQFWNFEEIY